MISHTVNQRYRSYIQPNNQDVFKVLDSRLQTIVPGWERSTVLDFGCNNGHLLGTSNGRIDESKYYGVDISKAALFVAQRKYPTANWVHYNGYNATFNPSGKLDAEFKLPVLADIGIAYGVFTHMALNDIKQNLERIRQCVRPGGLIIFSAWETTDIAGYLKFLKSSFNIDLAIEIPMARSVYLMNRNRILVDTNTLDVQDADWVEAFYDRQFLSAELQATFMPGHPTLHQVFMVKV